MQAGYDAERPRRRSLLDDALAGEGGMVYHPLLDGEDES